MPHSGILFSLSKQGSSARHAHGVPNDFYRPPATYQFQAMLFGVHRPPARSRIDSNRPFLIARDPQAPIHPIRGTQVQRCTHRASHRADFHPRVSRARRLHRVTRKLTLCHRRDATRSIEASLCTVGSAIKARVARLWSLAR